MATGELIDVPLQVLLAHAVIGAVVAPLEHGPEGLNAVRVGLALDVLSDAVSDGTMFEIQAIAGCNRRGRPCRPLILARHDPG